MKKRNDTPSLFDALPDGPREEARVTKGPPAPGTTSSKATGPAKTGAVTEGRPYRNRKAESLADQPARDRIRGDLDTSLVVEAAAGTGKTSELIRRIISVIKSGRAALDQIVAVTFTDAAAGELKLRLRGEIERERQSPDASEEEKKFLTDALPQLEEAHIGTIHSFCGDLLRERPVEAGIDPLFEVASDETSRPLFEMAFDRWFEGQLANPSEAVRRILRRRTRREYTGGRPAMLARRPSGDGPRRRLRSAALELIERRDFPSPWRHEPGFDRDREIDSLIDDMKELAAWAGKGDKNQWFTKSLLELRHIVNDMTRAEEDTGRDHDGIEARLFDFLPGWRSKNYVAYYARDEFPEKELKERREALKEKVQKFVERAGADLAPRLRDDLSAVLEEYTRLKERAGCLDFLDLLLRARDLVRENRTVREELQHRFTRVFVDEFQDTDPLQAEMLMLLAADDPNETDWRKVRPVAGKLFIVGDPKQSIYRFRRADVSLYEAVKRQVVGSGGALVELNVSFRSVPQIQEAVNAAFSRVMAPAAQPAPEAASGTTSSIDVSLCAPASQTEQIQAEVYATSSQARYVALARHRPGVDTQPAVVALSVPEPYPGPDYRKPTLWKIEESEPDGIAAFVEWLVRESGWTVTERRDATTRVPIQPRHVCLLFRRFRSFAKDVTRPYVRALEARRLPHLLVGGSGFHAREEIEAIRNALSAVERPDDELAVFATLRGPLFALTDAQLLAYRSKNADLYPFRRPVEDLPESSTEVVAALAVLRDLHRGRNRRPIADTIGRLLATTRAHAGFANWSTGEQALANVARLMDMARRTERSGLISFRAFVDWLVDQAETGEASDAPIIEEGLDGVRIMTVHKAKGLEFPVVILVDMTANAARDASRWTDPERGLCVMTLAGCSPPELLEHAEEEKQRDIEEAARVLYVAATRARDLLVVSAVGDQRYDDRWLSALNPAMYPAVDKSFTPETKHPSGCPAFGADNCIRPAGVLRPKGSVTPGEHQPEAGEHRVVWWDPSVLELGKQEDVGSRLNKLIAADDEGKRSQAGVVAHDQWQQTRVRVREQAGAPSLIVATATEHALAITGSTDGTPAESASAVGVESVGIDFSRPHGKRFGTLVHAVLSVVDLNADRAGVNAVASLQGRLLGASAEEIDAAAETSSRALAHPLMRRAAAAFASGRCRRESPVAIKLEDGLLVEGIVDLTFIDESDLEKWIVVDFKTDFEIGAKLEEYSNQVELYARAIRQASGLKTQAVLLRI
ncbi:MAG TPA: UvrD-helicase domain-containing protein [Blastocatellia bacterium]|nr:UvrD-helicase domain-containing protein [Blastocatellia bacterium]